MSIYFGQIRQIGHVVRNAASAMDYWTRTMGVGPFFVIREVEFADYHYRGHSSAAPVVTLCFAQSGDVQIELIDRANAGRHKFQSGIHPRRKIGEKGFPRNHPVLNRRK